MAIFVEVCTEGFSDWAVEPFIEDASARGPEGTPDGAEGRPFAVGVLVTEAGALGRGRSGGAGVAVGVGFEEDTAVGGYAKQSAIVLDIMQGPE